MTITPEQAAERIPGKYTIWDVIDIADVDRLFPDGVHAFIAYLFGVGVTRCRACGAYRTIAKCGICESESE